MPEATREEWHDPRERAHAQLWRILRRIATGDVEDLRGQLETKSFGAIERLGPVAADATIWLRLDLHECLNCGETNTLTVRSIKLVNENGKPVQKDQVAIEGLLINMSESAALKAFGERLVPGQVPAAVATP